MIQVYFDDVLIDDDYYTGLSNSFNLFNEDFKLGSTASNSYTLSIAKEAVTKQPNKIILKEDDITIAVLEVDDIAEDDYSYTYTLTDKMIDLEFYYDASLIFKNGKTTLLSIVQNICNMAGIELATTNFRGSSKQISWYDNRRTAREYIGFVAELNGGYAQIGKDGKLYFLKQNTASVKNISIDDCADFEIGEKHKITRVVYELGTIKYEFGNETANTLYLNSDNVFITEESEVESIYNDIKDFEFYSFKTSNCPVDFNVIAGQIITFTDGTNTYPTITGYDLEYFGGWNGGYTLEIATKKQEETKVIGTSEKIKNLSIKVDRNQNSITSLVEETTTVITTIQDNIVNLQSQIDGSIQFWNGSDIPTASNYPASEWTTEEEKNKHRADIYTVIEDIDGELKQGKSYRFDKVGNTWQWIELTDNELSAVQALAQSKAKVFVTTPKVPYSIGDLWLNNGKLLECQVPKDASGSYSASDWKEAVNYTDDTVANLAKTLANNAQSTADSAVEGVSNITNTTGQAAGKNIHIEDSAEEPLVDISLHGESNQKTRSGRNLLKNSNKTQTINGVTFTVNTDGSITANGTNGASKTTYQVDTKTPLNANTKYTLSGCSNGSTSTYLMQVALNKNGTKRYLSNSVNPVTFTASEQEIAEVYIIIYENATVNNVTFYPQIEEGSTATEYEPYGVMPSPEFPSEIENVGGKNLYDGNEVSTETTYNNILDTDVNSKWYGFIDISKLKFPLTFSTYINANAYTNTSIRIQLADKDKVPIATKVGTNATQDNKRSVITLDETKITEDVAYIKLYVRIQDGGNTENTQIEEGAVATLYAPYNSLEVKVEGKNLWENMLSEKIAGVTLSQNSDGSYLLNGTATSNANFVLTSILPKGDYSFSCGYEGKLPSNTSKRCEIVDSSNGVLVGINNNSDNVYTVNYTSETEQNIKQRIRIQNGHVYDNVILHPLLVKGTYTSDTMPEYEAYNSQTAYFPLAEGQKLMEGSYLADDGIHNKRKQLFFDGSDNEGWNKASLNIDSNGNNYSFYIILDKQPKQDEVYTNFALCSMLTQKRRSYVTTLDEEGIYLGKSNTLYVKIRQALIGSGTVGEFKSWLSQNPMQVEYELAEEEIEPYTEEQQKAWNKIKQLTTYKNITHITSEAYAKIVYARNNGLDIYETKQDAENKYTETIEKFAEQKITVDGIESRVSSTETTVGNHYTELKGKFDDYAPKSDIVTIQKSVTTLQTNTYTKTEINTKLTDGSVTKVLTKAGTFDENGLTIEENDAKVKSNLDHVGMKIMDATSGSDEDLMFAGYDEELNETIVRSKNMTVEKYFVESNVARREEYSNPVLGGKGIGVFML